MSHKDYPPAYYSFPPFFTMQPVLETRAKQLVMWSDWILDFLKHEKKDYIIIDKSGKEENGTVCKVFVNEDIQRKLSSDDIAIVLAHMESKELAKSTDEKENKVIISAQPFSDWVRLILQWADESMQKDSICTIFEMTHDSHGYAFHNVSDYLILVVLQMMEEAGKVKLIQAETIAETGVKFV